MCIFADMLVYWDFGDSTCRADICGDVGECLYIKGPVYDRVTHTYISLYIYVCIYEENTKKIRRKDEENTKKKMKKIRRKYEEKMKKIRRNDEEKTKKKMKKIRRKDEEKTKKKMKKIRRKYEEKMKNCG